MRHEIWLVTRTTDHDDSGYTIYENTTWSIKGNKWEMEDYARRHEYGSGARTYNSTTGEYEILTQ